MAMVIEQNACNTSELQSKLKLVNTLKIKVFKKKNVGSDGLLFVLLSPAALTGMPKTMMVTSH